MEDISKSGAQAARPSSLDYQAIGRVLSSVVVAGQAVPTDFYPPVSEEATHIAMRDVQERRNELSQDISWAFTRRDIHSDWFSDAKSRGRFEALARLHKAAKTIVEIVQNDGLLLASLSDYFPKGPNRTDAGATEERGPDFRQFMVGLRRLQKSAMSEREWLKSGGLHDQAPLSNEGDTMPPAEVFMIELASAYEAAFKAKPIISYNSSREASGPFVVFVQAVTNEMGELMSPDAIRKSFARARSRTNTAENREPVP